MDKSSIGYNEVPKKNIAGKMKKSTERKKPSFAACL
jgi:hypothetical protein